MTDKELKKLSRLELLELLLTETRENEKLREELDKIKKENSIEKSAQLLNETAKQLDETLKRLSLVDGATVIALAASLGVVLPWIRLSVIGNLAYETTAAQTALDVFGASLKNEVVDKGQFSTIAWAMTIGSIAPLILLPFLCKFLQKKVGKAVNKSEKSQKLGDAISASAFIGIVCAFLSREISGNTKSNAIDAAGNFS